MMAMAPSLTSGRVLGSPKRRRATAWMWSWLISIMTLILTFTCRMIPIQVISSGIRATVLSWKEVWQLEWVRAETVEDNQVWDWRLAITIATGFSMYSKATSLMTSQTFTATWATDFLKTFVWKWVSASTR